VDVGDVWHAAGVAVDWTAVGGISTAATGLVAIWALKASRDDSRERTRPVVIAEYRLPAYAWKRVDFVVRNVGGSVARDITVTFNPPLDPPTPNQDMRQFVIDRYAVPITTLGPGQELSNVVWVNYPHDPEKDDMPADVVVKIRYRRSRRRWYEDEFRLQTGVFLSHTESRSSEAPEGRLKEIRDVLKAIGKTLEKRRV